jgi:hypothetical protein
MERRNLAEVEKWRALDRTSTALGRRGANTVQEEI